MNEFDMIRVDVEQRGISRLCHFMQSRKLAHVLGHTKAILPTRKLEEHFPDLIDVTDESRLDGHLDHVCCSVEYPNVWYLRKAKEREQLFPDWVILSLDPRLVWERQALFCPRNAAAHYGGLLQPGIEGWTRLFEPQVPGAGGRTRGRTSKMLDCCPTDGQAEVLIPSEIPEQYIQAVIVPTQEHLRLEQVRLQTLGLAPTFEWRVAPSLFSDMWIRDIWQGRRPMEVIY